MTAGGPCVFTLRVKIVEMANCGEWRKLKGRQPRRGVVGEGAATVGYFQDFEHGGVHQPLGVPSFSFPSHFPPLPSKQASLNPARESGGVL